MTTTVGAADARAWILDALAHWAERGWLRRLDSALAAFVAERSPSADDTTLLAVALTACLEGKGHTCLVLADLLTDPDGLLGWPVDGADALRFVLGRLPAGADRWTDALAACDAVQVATDALSDVGSGAPFVLDHGRFYLLRYWRHERRIAIACVARATSVVPVDEALARTWIGRLFDAPTHAVDLQAVDWQRVACALALRARIALIVGGPGTGKTYTAARLLALLFATAADPSGLRVALAAPTGKAAARLRQSIDVAIVGLQARLGAGADGASPLADWSARIGPARTLHGLLGTQHRTRRFRHDATHPLALDVLIVDEASMVHVELMDALLDALPPRALLVLIGDHDQLSSVEAGAVLGELCRDAGEHGYTNRTTRYLAALTDQRIVAHAHGSALAQQTCTLRRSERFGGAIGRFARAVNDGRVDEALAVLAEHDDAVSAIEAGDMADRLRAGYVGYVAAVNARPDSLLVEDHEAWVRSVLDAFDGFRVLCAVREGPWGVTGLNHAIERGLAATGGLAVDGPRNDDRHDGWYRGRPVIATRNDADLGIFNGDVGVALPGSPSDVRLRVWFATGEGGVAGVRSVGATRLADVETAFALTVHRAQGSEFDDVVLVLPPASRAVTRELLYTGITRARRSFTLVHERGEVLQEAIGRTTRRSSGIAAMLESVERRRTAG